MSAVKKQPQPLHDFKRIDLDRHMVIEASAGTGKTFAVTRIVMELLLSGKVSSLDEILIVTFTEKATGEMRERLRADIKELLAKTGETREKVLLQNALDAFDRTSVFTIHGFCNRALQLYAFENRQQFSFTMVDDITVYGQVLRDIMRKYWHREYGEHLRPLLEASGFPKTDVYGDSKWMRQVIDIAGKYTPGAGDVIMPEPDPEFIHELERAARQTRGTIKKLSELTGQIDGPVEDSAFFQSLSGLNLNKTKMKSPVRGFFVPLLKLVQSYQQGSYDLEGLIDFWRSCEVMPGSISAINDYWKKPGPDYAEKMSAFPDVIRYSEELLACDIRDVLQQLKVATLCRLKNEARVFKSRHGLISYNDMISLVQQAVHEQESPLRARLQKKYRYALVDEFQDTDMLQWSIFRNVFLSGTENRLIIVGDPKQAIYGFRGADINAYYTARKEMLHDHDAAYYSLTANWRSGSQLIKGFNALFGKPGWFTDREISYGDSEYPENRDQVLGPAAAGGISVNDLGTMSGSRARETYARFMAGEIAGLISNSEKGLCAGDIAILVRSWGETSVIEQALSSRGVPYSYYKKKGLYQSAQALEIKYLIESIAEPGDAAALKRALITAFFNIPLDELKGYGELPDGHPATLRIARWHELAVKKNWGRLFSSLLVDSGLVLRIMDMPDWERQYADYRHICEVLSAQAYGRGLDIHGLLKLLKSYISQEKFDDEAFNYHRSDKEESGVQIMTIHASKGLQFPVVFVAGGFTRSPDDDVLVYHLEGRRVFDFIKDEAAAQLYRQELRYEEERLYYVAMTRAQVRAYVPRFDVPPGPQKGGPLAQWISPVLDTVRDHASVKWSRYEGTSIEDLPQGDLCLKREEPVSPENLVIQLQPPACLNRKIYVESFSSVHARSRAAYADQDGTAFMGNRENREPDEPVPQTVLAADEPEQVPRVYGPQIGSMYHEIIEEIDFTHVSSLKNSRQLAADVQFQNMVQEKAQYYLIPGPDVDINQLIEEMARSLWNTLTCNLKGSGLMLGSLTKKIHEMQFYYPFQKDMIGLIPEVEYGEGYIHGYIDLVFEWQGRYYILDWKSNYLREGYSTGSIEKNMHESGYILQYRIYAMAVIKWLKQVLRDFDYEQHFGGIYYIYLRGINPQYNDQGIYFYRPEDENTLYQWD